jgi:hypothetical protein
VRLTAALVASAVFAAACTGGETVQSTTTAPPAGSDPAHALMAEALGGTQSVQDFIVHLDMSVLAGDELIPILDQVLERAQSGAGDPADLAGGFTMRPVGSLQAEMLDPEGRPLPSLSVDFALLESTPEQTDQLRELLAGTIGDGEDATAVLEAIFASDGDDAGTLVEIVSASYSGRFTHAGPGDTSALDLSFLAVAGVEALVSVHLFGQTLPGDPAIEEGMSPHELFAYRWNQGLVQMLDGGVRPETVVVAAEVGDGETLTGSVPTGRLVAAGLALAAFPPGAGARLQVAAEPEADPDEEPADRLLRRQGVKDALVAEAYLAGFRAGWAVGEAMVAKAKQKLDESAARRYQGDRSAAFVIADPALPSHCLMAGFEGGQLWVNVGIPVLDQGCRYPPNGLPAEDYRVAMAFVVARNLCKNVANVLRWKNDPRSGAAGRGSDTARGPDATTATTFVGPTTTPIDPLAAPPETPSCDPPARPGRSGGTVGDVHLVTFDQVSYGNQAAGEFLVFENGVATVQMRTEPWEDSDIASVATAVAVRVDGHDLSMHRGGLNHPGQTWIDGEAAFLERGVTVALGDGALVWTETGWVVVWSDGTRLTVQDGGNRVMFTIHPSDLPATGMLGNGDGDPDNDLVTRDGTLVPPEVVIAPRSFYETYIDSWRITAGESLFHYGPGESTEGFHLAGFPDHTMTFEDLIDDGAGEAAEAACRAGGITRPDLVAACVYDLVVTGDDSFVYDHYVMQDSLPDPPAVSEPPPADLETDGPNLLTVGDLTYGLEASPGWCTADGISLGAAVSTQDPSGRQLDVSIQYVHADDPLLSVVVQVDGVQYAWVNTMVAPPSGSIDEHDFGGGSLTVRGSAFLNVPFDPGLSWNVPLPAGSQLVPFELRIRCDP